MLRLARRGEDRTPYPAARHPIGAPGGTVSKSRNQSWRKESPIATGSNARLPLAAAAELVVEQVWPTAKDKDTTRKLTDRARKRIQRDVAAGKVSAQTDGTILLADLAEWLRATRWAGLGRPGVFPTLPGRKHSPLERMADKKARLKGVAVTFMGAQHNSPLDKLTTIEACHQEIRRLNRLLDSYYGRVQKLYDELPEEKRRRAQQEGGRKGARRRWHKE